MKSQIKSALLVLLAGFLGLIVLFAIGSISGSGKIGFVGGSILYLIMCSLLMNKHSSIWWYSGVLINIPIWIFFIFLADEGQFQMYFWFLISLVTSSYVGALIGLVFYKKRNRTQA